MELARQNVQLEQSLREQIISRSMLTLVLTVALALLSVLQEQSLRLVRYANNILKETLHVTIVDMQFFFLPKNRPYLSGFCP